ncbi:MAG: hypothetical protein R3E01_28645 [Pirellulaceae bacterium]|nr:hypothetical protein [Planctomycetales bacterium]
MAKSLELQIQLQPDETTCGPTCLHAVYQYFEDPIPLQQVIDETPTVEGGGTLAVMLASHALRRGYRATIYTYNLAVFDPTWFPNPIPVGGTHSDEEDVIGAPTSHPNTAVSDLRDRLATQIEIKKSEKLRRACRAYITFLELGGRIVMQDLNATLIRKHLKKSLPILTGLSSTYMYRCTRILPVTGVPSDVAGVAEGHFVVLCGYDKSRKTVRVADPYLPNIAGHEHYYELGLDRLICSILLGVLTYDANLLIIEPAK